MFGLQRHLGGQLLLAQLDGVDGLLLGGRLLLGLLPQHLRVGDGTCQLARPAGGHLDHLRARTDTDGRAGQSAAHTGVSWRATEGRHGCEWSMTWWLLTGSSDGQ